MNSRENEMFIEDLKTAKLASDDAVLSSTNLPSFLKLLHGFSGWFASIFLLFSLGMMFASLFKNEIMLIVVGILLIGVAYSLLVGVQDSIFAEQFAIAISLAGQVMVGLGIFGLFDNRLTNSSLPWYILSIFELVVVFVIPNFTHRLLASFVFGYSLLMGGDISGMDIIGSPLMLGLGVWIWLTEYRHHDLISLKLPLGYGVTLSIYTWYTILHLPSYFYSHGSMASSMSYKGLVISAAETLILLYVVWQLAKNSPSSPLKILSIIFAIIIGAASFKVTGLPAGIALLLIGFSRGNKTLVGISLAFLIWLVSRFYYTLQTTLLVKSIYLVSMGTVLLILYALFRKFVLSNEETGSLS